MTKSANYPDIDIEALRERYRQEREKRLRAEGTEQYRQVGGEFNPYKEDKSVQSPLVRSPVDEEVTVAVIGGGFGGLLAAIRLHQAGVTNVRIIEKGADFGGVWYWNRYPGISCDIESYIYMPLLEEIGKIPTEKYAKGGEIHEHCRALARKFDLYDQALFQTEVTELRWDDETSRWTLTTDRGDTLRAQFVCMSTGPLSQPKLPGIAGIDTFKGRSFHTSRWDYGYTGGDAKGGLVGLRDKKVGIIGTGTTALQCIPHLGEWAGHLYVFQRTPVSVGVRGNRPTDAEWASRLSPGWQQKRMDNFNDLVHGVQVPEDFVQDGWTEIFSKVGIELSSMAPAVAEARELADFRMTEAIRARVDEIVKDPKVAASLKAYYHIMCKRPGFHDAYLDTFNRSNVTLVDTDGHGVDRITERGVVANGQEYEVDCLIFATGFEFQTQLSRRNGYEIYGRGGLPLSEKWKDGLSTLWGYHIRSFPNCFILGNGQSANTPNFTHMLNVASQHIAHVVARSLERGIAAVEPTEQAERNWVEHVMSFAGYRHEYDLKCTPSYYNNEGQSSDVSAVRNNFYPGGAVSFIKMLEAWREAGRFDEFEQVGAKTNAKVRANI